MTQDQRLWAKIDIGYLSNPKMADVLDASSNAVCMHLASILHSAQHLTDGHVSPKTIQRLTGGTAEDTQILIDNGVWHDENHDCDECPQPEKGRIYVHDYLKHNVGTAEISQKSAQARKAAEARWGKKNSNAERNAERNAVRNADSNAERNARSDQIRSDQIDTLSSDVASDTNGKKTENFPQHVHDLANNLAKQVQGNGHTVRTIGPRSWLTPIDRLIRLDGYTPEQVQQVIDWSQQDEFWQGNIRSGTKLREKFDQLKAKMFYDQRRTNNQNQNAPRQQFLTAADRNTQKAQALKQAISTGAWQPTTSNPWAPQQLTDRKELE